jgi:hypothetical protein
MSDLNPVTNYDDLIDSRDVIDRIEYLTNLPVDETTEDEESELTALTNSNRTTPASRSTASTTGFADRVPSGRSVTGRGGIRSERY